MAIVGKGKTRFEFVTSKGKTVTLTRDAFHAPDLPVDLIPPQCLVHNSTEGWFKVNGETAYLELHNGACIQAPFDPAMCLPMFYSFIHAQKAAKQLETCLYSCFTEENNWNLT